jgi:hypothetical protein
MPLYVRIGSIRKGFITDTAKPQLFEGEKNGLGNRIEGVSFSWRGAALSEVLLLYHIFENLLFSWF